MYEKYVQKDSVDIELQAMQFEFFKYQIKSAFNFKNINHNYERLNGIKYQFYSELIETHNYPMASFVKFTSDFKSFKNIWKRGNLAFSS